MDEVIIFRIDAELKQRLQEFAARNERSVSQEIRNLVRHAIEEAKKQPSSV
jgi:plasmid stability protein